MLHYDFIVSYPSEHTIASYKAGTKSRNVYWVDQLVQGGAPPVVSRFINHSKHSTDRRIYHKPPFLELQTNFATYGAPPFVNLVDDYGWLYSWRHGGILSMPPSTLTHRLSRAIHEALRQIDPNFVGSQAGKRYALWSPLHSCFWATGIGLFSCDFPCTCLSWGDFDWFTGWTQWDLKAVGS